MAITSNLVTITPQIAKDWLAGNVHNRPLKSAVIERLVGAILRGEWALNGETIKFNTRGELIDGQHRLLAIVKANQEVMAVVVRGLDQTVQETIDTGTKRKVGDILKLRGEKNVFQLGAALGWLWRYRRRQMRSGPPDPTPQELLRLLDDNPRIRDSLHPGARLNAHIRYPNGLAAFVHYILAEIDEVEANWFFERLVTGSGLQDGDPVLLLRQMVERRAMSTTYKMEQNRLAAVTFLAWKAMREDRQLRFLNWRRTGPTAEPFPYLTDD